MKRNVIEPDIDRDVLLGSEHGTTVEGFAVIEEAFLRLGQEIAALFGPTIAQLIAVWEALQEEWRIVTDSTLPSYPSMYTRIMVGKKLVTNRQFRTDYKQRIFLWPACTHYTVIAGLSSHVLPHLRVGGH